jgi:Ni/Co efflux regulator RcnB
MTRHACSRVDLGQGRRRRGVHICSFTQFRTSIDMRHTFLFSAASAACLAWAIVGWAAPSDQQQNDGQGQSSQQPAKGGPAPSNNGHAGQGAAATFHGAQNVQTPQVQQHVVQPQVQQRRTTQGFPGQPNVGQPQVQQHRTTQGFPGQPFGQPQVQQHRTTQGFPGQPNVVRPQVQQRTTTQAYPQKFNPRFGAPGYRPGGQQPQYSPQYFPRTFNMGVRYHWRGGSWRGPQGWYYRSWSYGQILPFAWLGSSWWISDYWDYGLPVPPYGYAWIRNGPDALLVNIRSGEVVEVVPGIFY